MAALSWLHGRDELPGTEPWGKIRGNGREKQKCLGSLYIIAILWTAQMDPRGGQVTKDASAAAKPKENSGRLG